MWNHEIMADMEKVRRLMEDKKTPTGLKIMASMSNAVVKTAEWFDLGDVKGLWDAFPDKSPLTNIIHLPFDHIGITYLLGPNLPRALLAAQTEDNILITEVIRHVTASHISWLPGQDFITLRRDCSGKRLNMVVQHMDKDGNKTFLSDEASPMQYKIPVGLLFLLCKLLECKNITTKEKYPNLDANKKRVRRGEKPLFSYKVLEIKPFGKASRSVSSSNAESENHNRIHLCRGHIKRYTSAKPLLGKHTGIYWWAPRLRGQDSAGFVDKDYTIPSPISVPGECRMLRA